MGRKQQQVLRSQPEKRTARSNEPSDGEGTKRNLRRVELAAPAGGAALAMMLVHPSLLSLAPRAAPDGCRASLCGGAPSP